MNLMGLPWLLVWMAGCVGAGLLLGGIAIEIRRWRNW